MPRQLRWTREHWKSGEFTIRELAELVIELTGAKVKLVDRAVAADDPTRRKPDITLAKKHFGWQPQISLRDGLVKTIDMDAKCRFIALPSTNP